MFVIFVYGKFFSYHFPLFLHTYTALVLSKKMSFHSLHFLTIISIFFFSCCFFFFSYSYIYTFFFVLNEYEYVYLHANDFMIKVAQTHLKNEMSARKRKQKFYFIHPNPFDTMGLHPVPHHIKVKFVSSEGYFLFCIYLFFLIKNTCVYVHKFK